MRLKKNELRKIASLLGISITPDDSKSTVIRKIRTRIQFSNKSPVKSGAAKNTLGDDIQHAVDLYTDACKRAQDSTMSNPHEKNFDCASIQYLVDSGDITESELKNETIQHETALRRGPSAYRIHNACMQVSGKEEGPEGDAPTANNHKKGGMGVDVFQLGERKGVIKEWAGNWSCYWDGSYETPTDRKTFVFRPCLEMTESGLVRTNGPEADWDLFASSSVADVESAIEELFCIVKSGAHGPKIGLGDESDYIWHPFAVSWTNDTAFTAQNLLAKLGAHEQLMSNDSICNLADHEDVHCDEDEMTRTGGGNISVFLDKHKDTLYFHTGSKKLNPLVVLAVARVKSHLVTGFIGGIVHT